MWGCLNCKYTDCTLLNQSIYYILQKYTDAFGGPVDDKFVKRVLQYYSAICRKGLDKLREIDSNVSSNKL